MAASGHFPHPAERNPYDSSIFGTSACDASGNGEGQTFLGTVSVTTDANGNATPPLFNAATGLMVTATATSPTNRHIRVLGCVTVPAGAADSRPVADDERLGRSGGFGTPFNYVITGQNLGPNPALGVVITDTLPAGLTATSASASQGTCTIAAAR